MAVSRCDRELDLSDMFRRQFPGTFVVIAEEGIAVATDCPTGVKVVYVVIPRPAEQEGKET